MRTKPKLQMYTTRLQLYLFPASYRMFDVQQQYFRTKFFAIRKTRSLFVSSLLPQAFHYILQVPLQ